MLQAMAVAFGRPADEVFSYISPRPVAAASLGQVYKAQLRPLYGSGEVAVKVQRPGVLEQVSPSPWLYCGDAGLTAKLPQDCQRIHASVAGRRGGATSHTLAFNPEMSGTRVLNTVTCCCLCRCALTCT